MDRKLKIQPKPFDHGQKVCPVDRGDRAYRSLSENLSIPFCCTVYRDIPISINIETDWQPEVLYFLAVLRYKQVSGAI